MISNPLPTPPGRLLLVEDDPFTAELVGRWLMSAGHTVELAVDGTSGLAAIERGAFDLVLADIELPGASGVELLQRSKHLHPTTPAVLMTARAPYETVTNAIDAGVDGFVQKPLSREGLVARIASTLAKSRARRRVVLAIGAHPDDVEIGCGGALLAHRAAGDVVVVLTLSHGESGGVVSQRLAESHAAADRLGATLVLAGLTDTHIEPGGATIRAIEDAVRRFRPTSVYTHSANDVHQDHRAAHQATLVAARGVPSVFCYQSPSSTIAFMPHRFVEIGAQLDAKLDALRCFHSQVTTRSYLADDMIRSTARYWGRYAGYGLVEPLEVVRETASAA